jgi:hypothetical protein
LTEAALPVAARGWAQYSRSADLQLHSVDLAGEVVELALAVPRRALDQPPTLGRRSTEFAETSRAG